MYLHVHSVEIIIWKSDVDVNVGMMDMGVDMDGVWVWEQECVCLGDILPSLWRDTEWER